MTTVGLTSIFLTVTVLSATTYNCSNFSVPGSTFTLITGIDSAGTALGHYGAGDGMHRFRYGTVSGSLHLVASGGPGGNPWSITSGSLPQGLTLDAGGMISGTPAAAVTNAGFTVEVTDSTGATANKALALPSTRRIHLPRHHSRLCRSLLKSGP